jgi:uncharacterized membrane protein
MIMCVNTSCHYIDRRFTSTFINVFTLNYFNFRCCPECFKFIVGFSAIVWYVDTLKIKLNRSRLMFAEGVFIIHSYMFDKIDNPN